MLDQALQHMRQGARVVLCGAIADYHHTDCESGAFHMWQFIVKRASAAGFMFSDYVERYPEAVERLSAWLREGRLNSVVDIHKGIETTPKAFCDMLAGVSRGKCIVQLQGARPADGVARKPRRPGRKPQAPGGEPRGPAREGSRHACVPGRLARKANRLADEADGHERDAPGVARNARSRASRAFQPECKAFHHARELRGVAREAFPLAGKGILTCAWRFSACAWGFSVCAWRFSACTSAFRPCV
jgi:hypothetical protein